MSKNKVPRSPCPVTCSLDILGDKWTLVIVRDLLRGKSQFKELLASPEGIATNILASRLTRMTENGLVEKVSTDSSREGYRLTAKGESLGPLLKSVAEWGLTHIEGTQALLGPSPEQER